MSKLVQVTAVNDNFPRGQKTIGAVLTYDCEIDPASVTKETYVVPGRTITDVRVEGRQVCLGLDPEDKHSMTRRMVGFGPNTKTKVTGAHIKVRQKKAIASGDKAQIRGSFQKHLSDIERSPVVDDFIQAEYTTADGKILRYNLFVPNDLQEGEKLPLVVFLHDSSVVSDNAIAPLIQGMGAIVWAKPEEQKKRPCFVLAPLYEEKAAFDDFTVTWHCEATAQLIREVAEKYPVDRNRILGTGQSMGTMMLCQLLIGHPDLFAGCFLVAGQWDPRRMAACHGQNLWILVSEKDEKAFPIMTESVNEMEAQGAGVARGSLDAKADAAEKQRFYDAVAQQKGNINFTTYTGGSVLPEGMKEFPGCYHLCTWLWAYDIEPIREWLFMQTNHFEKLMEDRNII